MHDENEFNANAPNRMKQSINYRIYTILLMTNDRR